MKDMSPASPEAQDLVCEITMKPAVISEPGENVNRARLSVANETKNRVEGTVLWSLRNQRSPMLCKVCGNRGRGWRSAVK